SAATSVVSATGSTTSAATSVVSATGSTTSAATSVVSATGSSPWESPSVTPATTSVTMDVDCCADSSLSVTEADSPLMGSTTLVVFSTTSSTFSIRPPTSPSSAEAMEPTDRKSVV